MPISRNFSQKEVITAFGNCFFVEHSKPVCRMPPDAKKRPKFRLNPLTGTNIWVDAHRLKNRVLKCLFLALAK